MLVLYDSKTGNVERFVQKLDLRVQKISKVERLEEPFVLITYTTGFGQVPKPVRDFLLIHHKWLAGVAASGNKNWGENFGKSANIIADLYDVPIISKFELSGTKEDVSFFSKGVMQLETYRVKQ